MSVGLLVAVASPQCCPHAARRHMTHPAAATSTHASPPHRTSYGHTAARAPIAAQGLTLTPAQLPATSTSTLRSRAAHAQVWACTALRARTRSRSRRNSSIASASAPALQHLTHRSVSESPQHCSRSVASACQRQRSHSSSSAALASLQQLCSNRASASAPALSASVALQRSLQRQSRLIMAAAATLAGERARTPHALALALINDNSA